jgi:hypothetical protein
LLLRNNKAQGKKGEEKAMKYFTPELYLKINSPDLDVVEKAHAKWEEALERYGKHLSEIRSRMTPATRKLANSLSLHDAEVLLFKYNGKLAFAELRQGDTHVFLVYLLAKNPLVKKIRSWPFSSKAVRWLYDEFDADAKGAQQHEVLLSDGRIWTLNFSRIVLFESARPHAPAKGSDSRRQPVRMGGSRPQKRRAS